MLCDPLDRVLDGPRAASRAAAVRLDPHQRIFGVPPVDLLDDVQHVSVSLPVRVPVIGAYHQDQVDLLGAVGVWNVSLIGPHDDVRLRYLLGPVLGFVHSLNDREVLGVDPDRPPVPGGTGKGLPLEQVRKVRHNGILQKFRCRGVRLLDFLALFVVNSLW